MRTKHSAAAVIVLAAILAVLLAAPDPCRAEVTVSIEIVYGGVIAGGLAFFFYFAASGDIGLLPLAPQDALISIKDGGWSLGLPVPQLALGGSADTGRDESIYIDILRWRF